MKFYYDGDSHSMALPNGHTQTTGHVLANKLGYALEHYGFPVKSPAQIIRSAIRYSFKDQPSFMAIGIGIVPRLEFFTDEVPCIKNKSKEYKRWLEEDSTIPFQIHDATRETQNLFHWQYMEVNLLFNLLQLHDYLLYNGKNFIIHNLGWNIRTDKDFIFSNKIYDEINNKPRFVNIFSNSMHNLMKDKNLKPWDYDKYKDSGHPDEDSHAMYADFLLEYIKKYV
jgi:hypothetical protein